MAVEAQYLFLEFVGGGDLSRRIGALDMESVLRLALQFCDGMVHAAHGGLCVHRDIKPQNCMITRDGNLKITDFGLARAVDEAGRTPLRQDKSFQEWLREPDSVPGDVRLTAAGGLGSAGLHALVGNLSPTLISDSGA